MRLHLANQFDLIYIFDLGGQCSPKPETFRNNS
jgi:hypothetical protein